MTILTFAEYQRLALRTARLGELSYDELADNASLGLIGEVGEVADLIKKAEFQGHELDTTKLLNELGDVLWYAALAAHVLDYAVDPRWIEIEYDDEEPLVEQAITLSLVVSSVVEGLRTNQLIPDLMEILISEIGNMAAYLGTPIGDVAAANIAKLERRYPSGQFEAARSQNREDVA